ncbi:MAG: hypothetical protein IJ660_04240 [Alphaproteobacteria bacterium]|nr:hypothetical protein [Alphaproteobacteria bacterium]
MPPSLKIQGRFLERKKQKLGAKKKHETCKHSQKRTRAAAWHFTPKQGKKLSRVATDLGWKDQVIDQIENGYHHTWKRYYELLKYYHGQLGIIVDK